MGAGQASEFAAQPADSSVGALIDAQRQEALNAETPRRRRRFRTNSEEVMLRTCVMFVLAVTCAAQDVPPPPRPVDAAPSPDSAAKFLQDKLGSIGRVSYNLTTHNTKTGATTGPVQAFEEITCILIAPRTCELKVQWDSNAGNSGGTFFLEEMGNAEVLTSQDFLIRSQPGVENTVSPTVYSVSLLSMGDFKVRDQPAANQIANALRQVVQQCKTLPPAAASGPGLEETLSFIEDKLNQQGAVNWLSTVSDTVKGTSGSPIQMSVTVAGVTGDPRSCRLTYHWTKVAGGKNSGDSTYALTLRRVEKLSVMTMEQANNAQHAREGHPELVETLSPALYELVINGAANRAWYFPFTDQDVSNRVAKAILHAVELCGGGKEPF
jgi:hypothetical protein